MSPTEDRAPRARHHTIRRIAATLLGFEVAYLVAAQLFLCTPIAPWALNRRPERLLIEWRNAWSLIPGVVHARGLSLRGQSYRMQWQATVERAVVPVFVPALALKSFSTWHPRADGVTFRLRRRSDTTPASADDWTSEIAGLDNPPDVPPEALYGRARKEWRWRVHVEGLEVSGLHEAWVEELRVVGLGRATSTFHFRLRDWLEIGPTTFDLETAQIAFRDEPLGDAERIAVEARFERFSLIEVQGWEALRHASGHLELDGRVSGARVPTGAAAPWLGVTVSGPLLATIEVAHGVLQPGSSVRVVQGRVGAEYVGYTAAGPGSIDATVSARAAGSDTLIARAALTSFQIGHEQSDEPHVRGADLELRAESRNLVLYETPFDDAAATLTFENAEVADIAVYDSFLPTGTAFELVSGRATMQGRFSASIASGTGEGAVRMQGRGIRARQGANDLRADFDLDVPIRRADLRTRSYDVGGSRLQVRQAGVEVAAPARGTDSRSEWWAEIDLPAAVLRRDASISIDASIRARAKDPSPIVALLASGAPAVRWLDRLLDLGEIEATGELSLGPRRTTLRGLEARADNFVLEGELSLGDGSPHSLLFLEHKPFSAALEVRNGHRDWKLTRSRSWFERRRTEFGD